MAVVDIAEMRSYLRIESSVSDSAIGSMIAAAEAAIAVKVGPLEPTEKTARPAGGYSVLILPTYPALSLTSVTASDESAVDLADLQLDEAGIVRYLTPRYFTSPTYTVVYMAGRVACPGDLVLAVQELVRYLWQSQRGSGRQSTQQSTEVANTVPGAASALPFRVEQLLAPHVSPRAA